MSAKSDKTREAFEAWAKDRNWDITHGGRYFYRNETTDTMYCGWTACAAESAQEVKRLREALCALVEHCEFVPMDSYYAEDTQAVLSNARAALQGDK